MTPHDAGTVCRGDLILKRIETGLKYATCLLGVPAMLASQANLPFARWAIGPLLVAMALWLVVCIVIEVGQRWGLVGTTLFPKSSASAPDESAFAPKRPPPPVVQKAADTLPTRDEPGVAAAARARTVHIPGRGDVRYRISSVD